LNPKGIKDIKKGTKFFEPQRHRGHKEGHKVFLKHKGEIKTIFKGREYIKTVFSLGISIKRRVVFS